jgi:membrane protease subunit HflK
MFYETMEDVLPSLKVIIDSGDSGVQKLLPLDQIMEGGTK